MRLLLESFSAACNGSYGIVTREIFSRALKIDSSLEIIQHGWLHNKPVEQVPWEIIPTSNKVEHGPDGRPFQDAYGDHSLTSVLEQTRPHLVWNLSDPWMCQGIATAKPQYGYKLVYYMPVDSEPNSPQWTKRIAASDELVAMSHFGKGVLESTPGLSHIPTQVVLLGVDQTVFRPLSKDEIKVTREEFSQGTITRDMKVIGWIGRDQPRKQVWQLYELLWYLRSGEWIHCKTCNRVTPKEFDPNTHKSRDSNKLRKYSRGYKYDHCWYCHSRDIVEGKPDGRAVLWTHMYNQPNTGWQLEELMDIYRVREYVYDAQQSVGDGEVSPHDMNRMYNCFDTYVSVTGGEGFGMPILEAMAAGIPVIYPNYSAYTDWAVGLPCRVQTFLPEIVTQRFRALTDMGDLIKNCLLMFNDHSERSILVRRALKVVPKFNWDLIAQQWVDILNRVYNADKKVIYGEIV